LLLITPAVLAKAGSFYQSPANRLIIRRTANASAGLNAGMQRNYSHYIPFSGIYRPNATQPAASASIGAFGKPWLRKASEAAILPSGYVGHGGIANATPGISPPPCAEFGCSPAQYIVGDITTKKYYRCWCDSAKKIAREKLKCFDNPGIVRRIGYSEGAC
jgi:hypothetical protein